MTETNIINRQPSKLDYASPFQFMFKMTKIPKVAFFVQTAILAGISFATAPVNNLRHLPEHYKIMILKI